MLRVDDEQKEVHTVEIETYRRTHMHGTLIEPLFNLISEVDVWVSTKSFNGVSLGWAKCK
jgi:hypothetical protein